MKVTVNTKDNVLVIDIPIERRSSKSGKNILVASTNGNIKTNAQVDAKPLTVSLNAYIPV